MTIIAAGIVAYLVIVAAWSYVVRHRSYVCGRKRWRWNGSWGRLDVSFPHGPRDYPWHVELRQWLTPTVWWRAGGESWPCYQLLFWRLYLRWWWGRYRWSAEEKALVPIE